MQDMILLNEVYVGTFNGYEVWYDVVRDPNTGRIKHYFYKDDSYSFCERFCPSITSGDTRDCNCEEREVAISRGEFLGLISGE